MATRTEIKDTQRAIAALDSAYARAVAGHERALARRAEVMAEQDALVNSARETVEKAVAEMAHQISAELTAHLLNLDPATVRRHAKSHPEVSYAAGR